MLAKTAILSALLSPCLAFCQIGVEMPSSPPPDAAGPSLEQTVDWIAKKLDAVPLPTVIAPKGRPEFSPNKLSATGEGCTVRITNFHRNAYGSSERHQLFNYKDLDPRSIKVYDYAYDGVQMVAIHADTLGDRRVIDDIDQYSKKFQSSQLRISNMMVDIEYGESLKRGLIHAQKLCTQKANAEKPPKPKDLF
ncbi:hypothetical protein [Acidovorax sp. sic0104]|uniref:hypothetical protein n=1 Tax=Acidovorax sp. sic0104 TaxID=2854784 RepID=UPI001C452771|nr:hypothetical protein [Acidovorax sp. sic0104]MBV7541970.1 hypothetical protein [Acidovorax sp. sic0104]